MKANKPNQIAHLIWKPVTIHEVCHAFLKGEKERCTNSLGQFAVQNWDIVECPDFSDETQNFVRTMLLYYRAPLLLPIIRSTAWFEVTAFSEIHLKELRVIGDFGWNARADANELTAVAGRKAVKPLSSAPAKWSTPILWAHTKEGPFTILEGNNRFVAYEASLDKQPFSISVYIGLSSAHCSWHRPDALGS